MGKLHFVAAALAVSCGVLMAQGQAANVPTFEFGFGVGVATIDENPLGDTTGGAAGFGARWNIKDTPVGLELRCSAESFELDDLAYADPGLGRWNGVYLDDGWLTKSDGSLQVLFSLARENIVSPYVALGFYFADVEVEYEAHAGPFHSDFSDSIDGGAFVARLGIDIRADIFYGRAEVSYVGDVFDDEDGIEDSAQVEVFADFGVYLCDNIRIDLFGDYGADAKNLVTAFGLTFAF